MKKTKQKTPPPPAAQNGQQAGVTFTLRDAQNMLAIARSATMPNADEAEARLVLFQRYQQFMAALFKQHGRTQPVEPPPAPEPEGAKTPVAAGVEKALRNKR